MRRYSRQRKYFHTQWHRIGSATVELAACFPVFMLILLGIIEFGRAMSVNQILNSAARIGCRAAILDGSTNSTVTNTVTQHVVNTLECPTSCVTVAITATSNDDGSALSDVSLATTGDLIELDVSVPFSSISWGVKQWLSASHIRGECSMQHE